VGDATLLEKTVVIYDYSDFEKHEGRNVDGTLGVGFFHKYVVAIDYAAKQLSIYDPISFVYSGLGWVIPLRILNGGTLAEFDAKIVAVGGQSAIDAHLAVDTGTYSALRLFRPFVEKHDFPSQGKSQIASFGFGAGGEFRQATGSVESLAIGSMMIANPVVDFSRDTKGVTASSNYDGTIGGEILRRFTTTLDYSRKQMIVKPNANFSDQFELDISGMILLATGKSFSEIHVGQVAEGSEAEDAGVREGDFVVAVDDETSAKIGLEGIRRLLAQRGGHTVDVCRNGRTWKFDLGGGPSRTVTTPCEVGSQARAPSN
jgi:hypothetical protein